MRFIKTDVDGCFVIEPDRFDDDRGFFARFWDAKEFAAHALSTDFAQFNLAYNHHAATLRGMHFQSAPHEEVKLVRCTRGEVYDAIIDLRPGSQTFLKWTGVELTADNYRTFYVPKGCAHGYITLVDKSEVAYQVSAAYAPNSACGVRWNDPAFGIRWPIAPKVIHERDANYPDFKPDLVAAR